jgi:hypothetical protein
MLKPVPASKKNNAEKPENKYVNILRAMILFANIS